MQRELTGLVEHLYQIEVPFNDELQQLAVRALDDVQRLQLYVRSGEQFPNGNDAA